MYKKIIEKIIQVLIISYIGVLVHKYGIPFLDPTIIQPSPEAKIPNAKDLVETTQEYASGVKYLIGTGISLSLGFLWNGVWNNIKKGLGGGLDFIVSGCKNVILPIITKIKESLPLENLVDSITEINKNINLEERLKNLSFAKDLVETVTETPMDIVENLDNTSGGLLKAAIISGVTTSLSKIKTLNESIKGLFTSNDRIEFTEIVDPITNGRFPLEPPIGPKSFIRDEHLSFFSSETLIGVGLFIFTITSFLLIKRYTELSLATSLQATVNNTIERIVPPKPPNSGISEVNSEINEESPEELFETFLDI